MLIELEDNCKKYDEMLNKNCSIAFRPFSLDLVISQVELVWFILLSLRVHSNLGNLIVKIVKNVVSNF